MLKLVLQTLKKPLMISLVLLRTSKPKMLKRSLKDLNFLVKVSKPYLMLSMPADLLNKNLWSLLLNFLLPLQLCLTPRVLLSTLERISLSTERTSIRKLKLLFMIGITNTLKIMVSKLVKSFTESLLVTLTVYKLTKWLLIFSLESLEVLINKIIIF